MIRCGVSVRCATEHEVVASIPSYCSCSSDEGEQQKRLSIKTLEPVCSPGDLNNSVAFHDGAPNFLGVASAHKTPIRVWDFLFAP